MAARAPTLPKDAEFLTVPEAAALLRVHPDTVRGWLRDGKLRGTRAPSDIGKPRWRILRSDLARLGG